MVLIKEYYVEVKGSPDIEADDICINNRPAWIKVLNDKESIKFLKAQTDAGRFFYTSFFGNYFLPESPTGEEVAIFYNHSAGIYNITMQYHRKIGDFIGSKLDELSIDKKSALISICSGSGIELQPLIDNGYTDITLLDISENMIKIAQEDDRFKSCKFIVADFPTHDFQEREYDVLICNMGIHHFMDKSLEVFLERVQSVVCQNGYVFILGINIPAKELDSCFQCLEFSSFPLYKDESNQVKILYYIGVNKHP